MDATMIKCDMCGTEVPADQIVVKDGKNLCAACAAAPAAPAAEAPATM